MSVCVFVRDALRPNYSYRHQTFHNSFLSPGKGRRPLFSEKNSIVRLLQAVYGTDQ